MSDNYASSASPKGVKHPMDATKKSPLKDTFHFAYIIYFTLGVGFLLPWNDFITTVNYVDYLYLDRSVDLAFVVVYTPVVPFSLLFIIFTARKSDAYVRINMGLGLFVVALLVMPIMDVAYIKGGSGLYDGLYVIVAILGLSGLADALVQGGLIGSVGELLERYMQVVVAGTTTSSWFALFDLFIEGLLEFDFWVFDLTFWLNFVWGFGFASFCVCINRYNIKV